ncbi:uncharacterized protein [Apostichopus japonicus]|uniref:uncharacterized protein n=1 Tax=Stichopus japonicus TaxID=307972 RepID=UPI003AB1853A
MAVQCPVRGIGEVTEEFLEELGKRLDNESNFIRSWRNFATMLLSCSKIDLDDYYGKSTRDPIGRRSPTWEVWQVYIRQRGRKVDIAKLWYLLYFQMQREDIACLLVDMHHEGRLLLQPARGDAGGPHPLGPSPTSHEDRYQEMSDIRGPSIWSSRNEQSHSYGPLASAQKQNIGQGTFQESYGGTLLSCPQGMPGYSHYSLSGRNTSDSGSSASGTSGSGSSGRGSSADTVVPSRGYNVGQRLNPSCALNLNCSQGACDYCEALRDLSEGNNVDHEPTTPKRNRDGAHPSSRNDMDLLPDLAQLYLSVETSRPMSDMSMYQEDFQTGAHSARTSGRNKSGPRDLTFQHGPMSRASYLPEGNSLPGREKNRRKRRLNNAWRRQDSQGRSYVTSESDDNMSQVTMMDTGQFFEADQEFVRTQTGSAAALRGIKESNCLVGITFHEQDAALAKRVKMHLNSEGCRSVLMDKSTMGLFDEMDAIVVIYSSHFKKSVIEKKFSSRLNCERKVYNLLKNEWKNHSQQNRRCVFYPEMELVKGMHIPRIFWDPPSNLLALGVYYYLFE